MSAPVQTQLFTTFAGEQEGIHSVLLPDLFSSGGCSNVWIDKWGRARKIEGYDNQNGTAVTTDTGGSATMLRALTPYRSTGAGVTTRQLLAVFDDTVDEWELSYSTNVGGTWTFIADMESASVGKIPDFAQFGDDLYITNGVIAPRRWNGTTLVTAGRTQSPTPSATANSSAGNLVGSYRYKIVAITTTGTRNAGSAASAVLQRQDNQANVVWGASTDTAVVGYELYRTSGSGAVYYLLDYIDGRTSVSYVDNTADIAILENRILEEHGDPPPVGVYFCESHKQRMWWLRTDTDPTRLYWSDSGLPEDVLADNKHDFEDATPVADVGTGMTGDFEGKLVVWMEKAVWTVSGTGQVIGDVVDWTFVKANAAVGTVSHRTVARIPAGSRYYDASGELQRTPTVTLAYLTPFKDIRLFDGDNDTVISHPKKDLLATMNYTTRQKAWCLEDPTRSEVAWFFPAAGSGEPDTCVVWNYQWGVWYERDWPFSCGAALETSSQALMLLAGERRTGTGGFIYQLWTGNTFDGATINAIWMTKTLYGRDPTTGIPLISQLKRWRWADIIADITTPTTITVGWVGAHAADNAALVGSRTLTPGSATLTDASGLPITDASGVTVTCVDTIALPQMIPLKHDAAGGDYFHDEGIRIRISDDSTNGPWALEALNVGYQVLPGMTRRM